MFGLGYQMGSTYNQLIIAILNIYIYTSLYELIHELSRVEPNLLHLIFELGFVFTKRFIQYSSQAQAKLI